MSHAKRRSSASATSRHETKQAKAYGPGLFCTSVELPGIEPAPGNALNKANAGSDDAKVRQTTRKHLRKRERR